MCLQENDLRWTSVQKLFDAKLNPSMQSIILAYLVSYSNVHHVHGPSSVGYSMHIPAVLPVVLVVMNRMCLVSPTNEVDIAVANFLDSVWTMSLVGRWVRKSEAIGR